MDTGKRIVKLREHRGWSQRELANRVDLNASVMNRIELGERPIKDHELNKIATTLEVTTDYILGRSESPYQTEEDEFQTFIEDPDLQRWYKELPKSKEEDLRRLRRIWEAFKEDNDK